MLQGVLKPARATRRARTTGLTAAITRWQERRAPPSDTLSLTQRNVYILPSRGGLFFALTLAVLLVASINFQLNLGYLLTFLLAGSGVVAMHMTHSTLRGLALQLRPVAPAFAGDVLQLEAVLAAPRRMRWGIAVRVAAAPAHTATWLDVAAGGASTAHLRVPALRRGWQPVSPLRLETRFPLGLFTAWAVWRPAALALVYPQPEPLAPPLPQAQSLSGRPAQSRHATVGEADGVRVYRRGDPLKSVVWKKAAQAMAAGGDLISRDSAAPADRELWLAWNGCGALAPEERLSRLTAWVLLADRAQHPYGLELPGLQIAPALGEGQRRKCLQALALWR